MSRTETSVGPQWEQLFLTSLGQRLQVDCYQGLKR